MLDVHKAHQRSDLLQFPVHGVVGVENELTGEVRHVGREIAVFVHGRVVVEAVLHPDLVVLLPVTRGDMNAAGPGVQGYKWRQDEYALPVDQGVAALQTLHHLSGKLIDDLVGFPLIPESVHTVVDQVLGEDQDLPFNRNGRIDEFFVEGNGQVGRDRPRGRRPDHDVDLFPGQLGTNRRNVRNHWKFYINGRRVMVRVFHFRLRQGGFACGAPVDGFLALVNAAVQEEFPELLHGDRLIVIGHRQIGVGPFPENAEALELIPLNVHVLFRVLPAEAALVRLGQRIFLFAQFLVHLMLDGKAMAVPAGHVDAVVAAHVLALDHHVLDDFVERRPQVNAAVGVGGTVMQDVNLPALRNFPDPLVNFHLFPHLQHFRLLSGEAGFHGEVGFRKVQTVFVVHGTLLTS